MNLIHPMMKDMDDPSDSSSEEEGIDLNDI